MVNQLMSQAIIREAIELRRLLPYKVAGTDMVSNVMTKNEVTSVFKSQTDMLIGNVPWVSLKALKEGHKPVWCVYCSCSDTKSQFDKMDKRWIAVCNICGAVNV